jgi:hypothetical protein
LDLCSSHDEVVLWFEHDLYDQTMLIYLLQWFARNRLMHSKLRLLSINSFPGIATFRGLGQLTPEQVRSLSGSWQPVTEEQLALAVEAWAAYASADPTTIVKLLASGTEPLPFLKSALLCHLERFPSSFNGLGQIERYTLQAVTDGIKRIDLLFDYVTDAAPDYGLGDSQYWAYLHMLRTAPYPLIDIEGPTLPDYNHQGPIAFGQWHVQHTKLGIEALQGMTDQVLYNGIDRWLAATIFKDMMEFGAGTTRMETLKWDRTIKFKKISCN